MVAIGYRTAVLAGLALAMTVGVSAQSTTPAAGNSQDNPTAAQAGQAPSSTPTGSSQTTPTTSSPAPGTTPVGGDAPAPSGKPGLGSDPGLSGSSGATASADDNQLPPCEAKKDDKKDKKKDKANKDDKDDDPEPGTTPVGSDCAGPVDVNKVIDPGSQMIPIKPGSIEDVSAVGNREIGKRGFGNWYSTDGEIKMGKQYADEIEKSAKFITDPVVDEYVNRIGQNIVKNSDCKVPFTIKVIDSDEINAFALPGGFFYVNSGLILAADEEAELAGVMAHETAHVCAHHAAREMTRMNYAQIGMVPLMIMLPYDWTGYGIYEAAQLAIPITFLQFSRDFEAQADYLGVQYMYRAGYDPQAFITFFEKVQALEKRKPGLVAKAFSDHPQTPDRILHTQMEIARILPAKDDYLVTTSEFDDVKARLARIEDKRRLIDNRNGPKPSLRRASTTGDGSGGSNGSGNSTASGGNSGDSTDGPPTLHRRDDQN
ncbi:MAG TPA: M48 family metallopeptidase [Terracidiphilus sp.]|nr:M48 family metallopeptidase [Terracidiphilus sp.]